MLSAACMVDISRWKWKQVEVENAVIKSDAKLLDALIQDEALQQSVYQAGPYWKPYQDRMVRRLRTADIGAFRSDPQIGKGFADCFGDTFDEGFNWKTRVIAEVIKLPGLAGYVSGLRQRILLAQRQLTETRGQLIALDFNQITRSNIAKYGWPVTERGGCQAFTSFDGQSISSHYVEMAHRIGFLQALCPCPAPRTYMEIGGGFGAMAHLMRHWHPSIEKVILIDLPPVIYVTTQYLKSLIGDDQVFSYSDARGSSEIDIENCKQSVICLPPWCAPKIRGRVDLLHNAASFSEMSKANVAAYADVAKTVCSETATFWFITNKEVGHPNVETSSVKNIEEAFRWMKLTQSRNREGRIVLTGSGRPS